MDEFAPLEFRREATQDVSRAISLVQADAPSDVRRAAPLAHADACFRLGTGHEADGSPCQDYALAEEGVRPFAIVSDGCSTSGRTDLGARVLALAARRLLRAADAPASAATPLERVLHGVLPLALEAAIQLGLDASDLDATLAVARAGAAGGADAFLFGDGVVAARTAAGLEAVVVDWAGNMPGYPGYWLDAERKKLFCTESEAFAAAEGRAPCQVTRWRIVDGVSTVVSTEKLSAASGLSGVWVGWGETPDVLAVMSDGALQVAGINWVDVVSELTAVKAARTGAFMQRRAARALAAFAKRGGRPVDDLAVAALAAANE